MIKDFVVLDNFLKDPNYFIQMSKTIEYYSNENIVLDGITLCKNTNKPDGKWRGYRSDTIGIIDNTLFLDTCNHLIQSLFHTTSYTYRISCYMHILSEKNIPDKDWLHIDPGSIFAGVVYLNNNIVNTAAAGTTIIDKVGKKNIIKNKFNRLVFYKANLLHKPNKGFGNNINNSRLTLTFFIHDLILQYNYNTTV